MRPALCILSGSSLLLALCACLGGQNEDPVVTDVFEAGPKGGVFASKARGNAAEGVSLELPEKALERDVKISLGYSRKAPRVRAGYASGMVVVIEAAPETVFAQPLRITVRFKPSAKYKGVMGYRVNPDGGLQVIDLVRRDLQAGEAVFATFVPLSFTWVYLP